MNGHACLQQNILFDHYGGKTAGSGHILASAGTFSLRRSHYFNASGTLPEVISGHTGVVIPFINSAHKQQRT
jgi:hypothetical protein